MIRKLFIFLMLLFLVSGCAGMQSKPEQGAMGSDRLMDMLAGSEVNKVRAFTTHTGGGLGALDKIATANLSNGDISFVITGGKEYVYVFDSTGSDAEDAVDFRFIRPDDFGAAGVWDLLSRSAIGYTMAPSTDPVWEFMDSESPGADKSTAWIKAVYVDGADGSENGDIFIEVIKGGAENTEVLRYDESDDRWETTQGLQMTGALTIEGAINLGTGGVVITDDGDGAITILGAGDGFDENLTFNFDDTENTVGVTSGTSVGTIDLGSIILKSPGVTVGNAVMSEADFEQLDDITAGTGANSKAVVLAANGNFTAPAGTWDFSGATALTFGALNLSTTGIIAGAMGVMAPDADGHTITAAQAYGYMHQANGAATWILPAVAVGMSVCVYSNGANAVVIDPNINDGIILNGAARDTDGDSITSASAAGDFICLYGDSADGWTTLGRSGTWTSN